ncbi:hypothetical protein EIP86_000736 [Pleurotus ostreatoroseus]|nr:hypothetical protein EIP86_000736 [Pleurotus ostreatoroseus]
MSDPNADSSGTTSSFWNRQTFLSFLPANSQSRHTPIWTGWQVVEPDDFEPSNRGSRHGSGGSGNSGRRGSQGIRTPGEGSPRGSGEEVDPFLVRRSIHSGTVGNEMSQTKTDTDTLVSVPPAALTGAAPRSSPPRMGHIIPRDVLLQRMAEEDEANASHADIRLVKPSPKQDTKDEYSPLSPPPPLDPDGMKGLGVRTPRSTPDRSVGSRNHRSIHSEKSGGSLDDSHEQAELLVARRVRVGEPSRLPTIQSESETGTPPRSALGLSGLSNRLGRLSWFKRMSGAGPSSAPVEPEDTYTRSPPRSPPRSRGHSRPGSASRLLDDIDLEAGSPLSPRFLGDDSGVDMGLLGAASSDVRPLSSVSAKSASGTSGQSVYHDARSRPGSSVVEFPVPVISRESQERLAINPPPTYEQSLAPASTPNLPAAVDPLDMPIPAPSTQLGTSRPTFPPGLVSLPAPSAWRDSYPSSPNSSERSSSGIVIDIEDDPPEAQEEWRDLSTDRDGRRRTFGVPNVTPPQPGLRSQHPSIYTVRSQQLRPQGSRSPVRSLGASSGSHSGSHTHTGSASQPSITSPLRSVSSAQSLVISGYSDDRREGSDELYPISPPLSAVMGSMSSAGGHTRPPSYQVPPAMPPVPEVVATPASSTVRPVPSGTVTTSTTTGSSGTGTNSSVTTSATDPVTGAVLHFPAVPWRRDQRSDRTDSWGRRPREDW